MSIQEMLSDQLIARCSYDANNNPEYLGKASPGSGTDQTEWRIRKLIYNTNDQWLATLFAQGDTKFNKVWDQRETYTYS